MTPAQLDRLLALADAATPGPWHVSLGSVYAEGRQPGWKPTPVSETTAIDARWPILAGENMRADAAFIAAANPDTIRALVQGFADTLDEVERLSQIERTARHMAVFDQPDGSSAEDAMAQLRAALEPKP